MEWRKWFTDDVAVPGSGIYVTGKKLWKNNSKYLTKFQTNRTVKCNDACEEKGVKCLLKDEQEWRLISYIGWTGISDECKLTVSGILHLLLFLPQPTESIWFPTIWSNTSPGKSNKYLHLSVHHLAILISTSIQTYQCVLSAFFCQTLWPQNQNLWDALVITLNLHRMKIYVYLALCWK